MRTALAVENPEIPEVMDLETGAHQSLAQVVGLDYDRAVQLRMAAKIGQKENSPLYACSECGVSVNLLMHPESRRFYFKHTLEDGRCSAVTHSQLTREEMNARKYNGAKESTRHLNMKKMVTESLRADPRFSEIVVEGTWKSALTGRLRRPDVRATYVSADGQEPIKVAFEIQLSTTYLDVIAERRLFYLAEGALLFWIFAEFNDIGRRLTQDDVFFNNNQNAFLVNEETTKASLLSAEFHLTCVWAEPTSFTTTTALQRELVSFKDLTLIQATQQAYHFDFYGALDILKMQVSNALSTLRDDVEAFWVNRQSLSADKQQKWRQLVYRARKAGISLPDYYGQLPTHLLDALYSAKFGKVIGWDFPTLVQLAHWVVATYKPMLQIFRKALFVYNRGAQLVAEDKSGKWRMKAAQYKREIAAKDLRYVPDPKHDQLVAFLFPELCD